MAYNNPVRLILQGDRVEAARYIDVARAALWKLARATQSNGATTTRHRLQMAGGVTVDLSLAGLEATIVINAPLQNEEKWVAPHDFVVWPRDAAHTSGIDAEHPQLILRIERNEKTGAARWTTYFYNQETGGYADFAGRKGSYFRAFPNGVANGGNIEWESPRGEVISWYGPSARYWYDAYAQLRYQYGKFVFMNGQKLLDVDAYVTASTAQAPITARWIIGAALRYDGSNVYLFTVQSEAPDMTTDMTTLPGNTVKLTDPAPHTAQTLRFYRYTLDLETSPQGLTNYRVRTNSRILLGSAPNFSSEPWFFNPECTEALVYTYPDGFVLAKIIDRDTPPDSGDFGVGDQLFPPTEQFRIRVPIALDSISGSTVESLSVTNNGVPVPIASDYAADGSLVTMNVIVENDMTTYLELAGTRHQLSKVMSLHEHEGDNRVQANLRWVVFADLRNSLLVMMTYEVTFTFPGGVGATYIEIYKDGALVHRELNHPFETIPEHGFSFSLLDHDRKYYNLRGRSVAPYYYVFGMLLNVRGGGGGVIYDAEFGSCNYQYNWLPYPSAGYFGTYDPSPPNPASHPPTTVGSRSNAGFNSNLADGNGHYNVTACNFYDKTIMLSLASPSAGGDGSYVFVSNETLARLTGVSGTNARYHPLWRIGKPAGSPAGGA